MDSSALDGLAADIGWSEVAEVVELFVSEVPIAVRALRAAAERRNPEEVGRLAHSLASTCSALGIGSVASRLRELEHHAHQAQPRDVVRLIEDLDARLGPAVSQLRDLVTRRAGRSPSDDALGRHRDEVSRELPPD